MAAGQPPSPPSLQPRAPTPTPHASICLQITSIGSFLDPLADKVLVNGMAVPLAMQGLLPPSLVALVVGRDLSIIAGVMYSRALTIEGGFSWAKYFNVSASTPQNLKPTNISKINTVLQCTIVVLACARGGELLAEPEGFETLWTGLLLATGVTTAWSWADYFNHFLHGNRNWQKSLENPEEHERVINAAGRFGRGADPDPSEPDMQTKPKE